MAGGGAKVVPSFDPDETFDVCDTENNVIGQAPRAKSVLLLFSLASTLCAALLIRC